MTQLTINQAAELRGVNHSTIWRWIKVYGLEAQRLGSVWVIDADQLKNFIPPRRGPKGKKNELPTNS